MAFLFIWQFILSGPLEIASGYIGFANYSRYVFPGLTREGAFVVAAIVGAINIALLYRRIESVGRLTVSLWIGTMVTTLAVVLTGVVNFNPQVAFDLPPDAFRFSTGFLLGLGAATRVGIYDYLGYYDICYIGDEVRDPGRVIPRSIMLSVIAVAILYIAINLSVIGVVPWRTFVPSTAHPEADFIVSIFMERIYGSTVATIFTAFVLWTAFGSVFALLLGYSRIPYAAALDGTFFRIFGRVHAQKHFPHVSLLVIGVLAIVASALPLDVVIASLITTRILIQFVGQIAVVIRLRKTQPDMPRPFRMWLYPVPALVALAGWIFVSATSGGEVIGFGLATLGAGVVAYLVWRRRTDALEAAA
jgi:amino acid transporter